MNSRQRVGFLSASLVLLLFALFPPWIATEAARHDLADHRGSSERRVGALRRTIFAPPPAPTDHRGDGSPRFGPYRLDWARGLAILAVVVAAGMCAVLALASTRMRPVDACVLLLMGVVAAFLVAAGTALLAGVAVMLWHSLGL